MTVLDMSDLPMPWRYSKEDGCLIAADGTPIDWSLDADVFDEVKRFEARACNHYATLRQRLWELCEVVDSALECGLFLSVDGKRPDVMALKQSREALAADEKDRLRERGRRAAAREG